MKYFIADTHFFDNRIITLEQRPFRNADDMNKHLIANWNSTVEPEDEIFFLGDFIGTEMPMHHDEINFGKIKAILDQLHGNLTFIMGNHDVPILNFVHQLGYVVSAYPIIIDGFWVLSHEPIYLNKQSAFANIFGHVHGNPIYRTVSPRSYCVSAERIDYTPISFDTVKSAIHNVKE